MGMTGATGATDEINPTSVALVTSSHFPGTAVAKYEQNLHSAMPVPQEFQVYGSWPVEGADRQVQPSIANTGFWSKRYGL